MIVACVGERAMATWLAGPPDERGGRDGKEMQPV